MTAKPHITDPHISDYCSNYSTKPEELFYEIEKITIESVGQEKMLTGHYLGMFLRMFTAAIKPKTVLELGTFTGYGTQNFVTAMKEGDIYTIDNEPKHQSIAENKVEYPEKVKVHFLLGPAIEILKDWQIPVDLVFIDAAKKQYGDYYDLILPHLNQGGVILADNVLWKGKVGRDNNDKLGSALDKFNQKVYDDERVDNVILPIDDGIHFIIKK